MNLNSAKALTIAWIITAVVLLLMAFSVRFYKELSQQRAHDAAVADVENFIYQKFPTMDAATRRGHAEILISSTCVEIVENAIACQGGGLTKVSPEVRQYALRAAEAHGIKQ